MKMIEQEKQDTINKTNESFKLLEEAKAFVKDEDQRMVNETNSLKEQIYQLEITIKKLDDELVEEARKNRDLRKNTGDSVSADETADAKARRKALRAEIDILVNQILQAALDNMKETKASRVSGLPGYKSKQSIFDEVIREDEKIRDKKIEIENQNALFRNNAALLASKEFDLSLLELEKQKIENSIQNLINRQRQSEETLSEVVSQRQEIQADTKSLENEIKKYESLIDVLNREVGDRERSGPRKTEKKMNKIPNTGTAEI